MDIHIIHINGGTLSLMKVRGNLTAITVENLTPITAG
jgi:hypothetical protein